MRFGPAGTKPRGAEAESRVSATPRRGGLAGRGTATIADFTTARRKRHSCANSVLMAHAHLGATRRRETRRGWIPRTRRCHHCGVRSRAQPQPQQKTVLPSCHPQIRGTGRHHRLAAKHFAGEQLGIQSGARYGRGLTALPQAELYANQQQVSIRPLGEAQGGQLTLGLGATPRFRDRRCELACGACLTASPPSTRPGKAPRPIRGTTAQAATGSGRVPSDPVRAPAQQPGRADQARAPAGLRSWNYRQCTAAVTG